MTTIQIPGCMQWLQDDNDTNIKKAKRILDILYKGKYSFITHNSLPTYLLCDDRIQEDVINILKICKVKHTTYYTKSNIYVED